jgi:hypothetical protein
LAGVLGVAATACNCSKDSPSRKKAAATSARDAAPDAEPEPHVTQALRGIWGSAKDDIWVVGNEGVMLHYDGKSWQSKQSGTSNDLTNLSGTAPDDVWAVGSNGVIMHFDGRAWTLIDGGNEDLLLLTVLARSRSEVWVGGVGNEAGFVRRYQDGKVAETEAIPGCTGIWRSWPVADDDIWFVGSDRQAKSFAMHRAQGAYAHRPLDAGPLRAVFGAASDDVWIAAYDGPLHHWDGAHWQDTTPEAGAHWLGMWGTAKDDIWVFGLAGVVYHYDGKRWTKVPNPSNEVLWSAWGATRDDVWFVGKNGTLVHWDGKALKPSA